MDQKPEGAVAVFVLGLLGLLVCQILGIIAWVLGNSYIAQCREMGTEPEPLAVAGRILGIISTILMILGVIVGVVMGLIFIVAAVAANNS